MTDLNYPFSERAVRSLRAGETVRISGLVHTGRDKLHKHFADSGVLPVDFREGALYHCGPVVVRDGASWRVVAAGPTTNVRENPYEPLFIERTGVRVIIGKGGMDKRTLEACERFGCIYVQAVGGAAALCASCVRKVCGVDFLDEFGAAEACWHFEMQNFTGIVAMDACGNSLFSSVAEASAARLRALLAQT